MLNTIEIEVDYTYGVGIPVDLAERMKEESHVLFKGIWDYEKFGEAIADYDEMNEVDDYEALGKECHDGAWEINFEEGYAVKFV